MKYKKNIFNSSIMINEVFFKFFKKNKQKLKLINTNTYYLNDYYSKFFVLLSDKKYNIYDFKLNDMYYFKKNTITLDSSNIKKIAKTILSNKELNAYRHNIHILNKNNKLIAVDYINSKQFMLNENIDANKKYNDLLDLGIFGIFGITIKSLTKYSTLYINNNNVALQVFFQNKYYVFIILNNF